MSESKGIPIFNPKTGEKTFAKPAPRQEPKQDTAAQEPLPTKPHLPASTSGPVASSTELPSASAGPAPKMAAAEKAKAGKEKVEIGSLADLLFHAYSLKGRRLSLNSKLTKTVASNCRLDEAQREELLRLATGDQQLVVAKQLLLLATSISGFPHLRAAIREAVRSILVQHAAFKTPAASSFMLAPSEAAPLAQVLTALQCYEPPAAADSEKESGKALAVSQLRDNACFCAALWYAESNGVALPRIVDSLYSGIWEPAARTLDTDEAKWRTLADLKDADAVGLACDVFRRESSEQWQRCQKALADARELSEQVSNLELQNQRLRVQIQELQEGANQEMESLRREMNDLQAKAEIQAVHQRDDAEQIRSRLLRRLKADLSNLEEGLTALRRPEPKVHVMMDIAERVTDAMRKEIRNLQGEE